MSLGVYTLRIESAAVAGFAVLFSRAKELEPMTEIPETLKLIALGGAAGVLSGMFGIGGGLVIVPALVLIFGFDVKTAIGTSLFVILLPTGLLGVLEYYKNGQLRVPAGLFVPSGSSSARISERRSPARCRRRR